MVIPLPGPDDKTPKTLIGDINYFAHTGIVTTVV
jgi:hypothetical protein